MIQEFFSLIDIWFKIVTFVVCLYVVIQLRGGRIMYPILLIGAVSLFGFLSTVIGSAEFAWLAGALQSLVILVVAVWFSYIFKP